MKSLFGRFSTKVTGLYTFDKLKFFFYQNWIHKGHKKTILIYSIGKTASTSLYVSLKNQLKEKYNIYHAHFLQESYLKESEQGGLETYSKDTPSHIFVDLIWRPQFISKRHKHWKMFMVSCVREPMSRRISEFFQLLHLEIKGDVYHCKSRFKNGFSLEIKLNDVQPLIEAFYKNKELSEDKWFEGQIKDALGLDLFTNHQFDKTRGVSTFVTPDQHKLTIYRLENLTDNFTQVVEEEIGEKVSLEIQNTGATKSYAPLYAEFKRQFDPSEAYLDTVYNSKYSTFFYTQEELEAFKTKWRKS